MECFQQVTAMKIDQEFPLLDVVIGGDLGIGLIE